MKLLVVKLSALGDVIQALPVAKYLREKFPDAQIDWIVEKRFADLVRRYQPVSHVLTIDTKGWKKAPFARTTLREIKQFYRELRKEKYDYVFDIQGNIKSGFVTFGAKSRKKVGFHKSQMKEWLNCLATNRHIKINPHLPISDQYLELTRNFFRDFTDLPSFKEKLQLSSREEQKVLDIVQIAAGRPILMICPASAWENKRLSESTWVSLLRKLQGKYNPYFFLIYGSEQEKIVAESFHKHMPEDSHVIGALPLPIWQRLMGAMVGVVSVDSSALHLAAMAGVPTFSMFGPSNANIYGPVGSEHESFQGSCPYNEKFVKRCDHLRTCKTGLCMKQIKGEELFDQVANWYSAHCYITV